MYKKLDPSIGATVCILAYNHEHFIEQAISSVINQKTNFTVEILVGEDASTDNTKAVLEKLKEKHPDKFDIIYQDPKNKIVINGRPTGRYNFLNLLDRAKGRYIATLDGDDFWTDPNKLQKQFDLLDANPDCAGCFHNTEIIVEGTDIRSHFLDESELPLKLDQVDLLEHPERLGHTSSFFFRNKDSCIIPDKFKLAICDRILAYIVAKDGPWMVLKENMSCYRKNKGGVYSLKHIVLQTEFLKNVYLAIYTIEDNEIGYGPILKKRLAYYNRILSQLHRDNKNYKSYFSSLFLYIKFEKKNFRLLKILIKEEILNVRK